MPNEILPKAWSTVSGLGMQSYRLSLGFAHTLCLLTAGLAISSSAQTTFDATTIQARAEEWIRPYVEARDFSGVLLIGQGDQVLVEKAYGKADFQLDVANRIETRFRIASLSKTFTAAAIEILIAQGKLSLKDHLSQYVGGIANGERITVEQLLLHESGVGELDDADAYRDCLSTEELVQRLRKVPPLFQPGSDSHYSNEGYFLLALILQKVSVSSYGQFLQTNIFGPLKLTNTGSTCKDLPPGPNAAGHVPGGRSAQCGTPSFP